MSESPEPPKFERRPLPPSCWFPDRAPDAAYYLSSRRFSPGVTVTITRPGDTEPTAIKIAQQGVPPPDWSR